MLKRIRTTFEMRVALIYVLMGSAWIIVSDRVVARLFPDPGQLTTAQTIKALFYVLVSGLWMFYFLSHEIRSKRKAEANTRSIFENAVEGIFQSTPQGRLLHVNRAMAQIYGYASPTEMIDAVEDIASQIYAEAEDRRNFTAALLEQEIIEDFVARNLRSDGSVFWTSTNARLVRDPQGKPLYFEGFVQEISSRKKAEEALASAERRYRALIEQIPAVVYIDSRENVGEMYYISPQIESLLGYKAGEWVSDPQFWNRILHPDDRARVLAEYKQSQATGERFDCEYRLIARDGQVCTVRDMAMLVPSDDAGVQFWQGVIVDVTERKQSERVNQVIDQIAQATISTRTLEELYAFIHHALSTILPAENFYIALYDPASNLVSFPYLVDQFDNDTTPRPPRRGLTEYVLRSEAPLLASPEVFEDLHQRGEVEPVGPDSIDWLGVPLVIDGRVIGVMAVQSYVSGTRYSEQDKYVLNLVSAQVALAIERKRAETALSESEQRYRRLIEFSPEAIAVYSQDRVVYTNPAGLRLIGATDLAQILDRSIEDFIHPDYREMALQRSREALENWTAVPILVEKFTRLDGSLVDVEVTSMPLVYDGKPAVQIIVRDITDRLAAEEALRRQLLELTVLNAVAAVSVQTERLDDLFAYVTHIVSQAIYPDNCGILEVNWEARRWKPHASYHGTSSAMLQMRYPIGEGVAGKVFASGQIIRIGDVRQEPAYIEATAGIQSEIAVPIFMHGRVCAVINAESRQMQAFSEQDERLLVTIADTLTVAIEKIHLLQTEMQRRAEAEVLREATAALSGPLDLSRRYELIFDYLAMFAPYDRASIALSELGAYKIVSGRNGAKAAPLLIGKTVPSGQFSHDLANTRQPLVVDDVQKSDRFDGWPGAEGIHGWMAAPLVAYDTVIGFLYLDSLRAGAFSQEQAALVQVFANQAAVAIENARLYEAEQSRRRENSRLLDELQVYNLELSMAYDVTLEGWGRALELRDRETQGHTRRVSELTLRLARRMGVPENEIPHIRRGVLLHDIGKMGIPDTILKKSGPLSDDEWVEMRKHPQYAYDLLYPILYLRPALDIPYCHHERWDGGGYPRGLRGEEIPLAARIFSVIDVWDSLLHDRAYLKACSKEQALAFIKENRGARFDPRVVDAFLELIRDNNLSL